MGKNQRHSKEAMFLSIELWQESGVSQKAFCDKEELSVPTFRYWLRKYKNEKESATKSNKEESFIPLRVPGIDSMIRSCEVSTERITVSFPNGVRVSCPVGIDMHQLRNLINH